MTRNWIRPVQMSLGALALGMAAWVGAQTPPPAEAPPTAPAVDKAQGKPPAMGKHHRPHHRGDKARHHRDPAAREAAAARDEARRGKLDGASPQEQLQRNALARCDVFKMDLDRQACVERVRNGQVSGSVEGGGTITEYTQQVPVSR